MAPARLFEKVDALRSEGELDKVQALLEEAWAQVRGPAACPAAQPSSSDSPA